MFQRGLDYLYRGGKSYSNIEMNFFHRAIEFDPDFALAYIWLGYAIFEKANQSIKTRRYTDTLKYYSDKAIKINPNLSDAYWLRGQYFLYNGEYDLALEDFNIAIDVNPKNGPAHKMRGMTYQRDGNYFEAHRNYMKAKQLLAGDKKFYPELLVHLGDFYQSICDSEEAEVAFKELLGYSPVLGNEKLCELAIGDGNWNNLLTYLNSICAIDAGERCARFQNDYYVFTGAFDKISTGSFLSGINFYRGIDRYGYVLVRQGRKEKSAAYFNQRIKDLEARMNRDHHSLEGYEWYELAAVYAYKGNRDKAYQMLQEIEKAKVDGFFIRFAKVDPFFENLWDDIEFQQFIRRQENRFAEIRVEINKLNEQGSI